MYPQNMSSVNQVAIPKRGYRWGYKFYLKVKNALFIWLFRLLSIDPSPPNANLKAARFNHLAAFFLGKSRVVVVIETGNIY